MRRAGPWLREQLPSFRRSSRSFAAFAAFGLSGACSVYGSGLLDDASDGVSSGGSGSSVAGRGGTHGGALAGNGGKGTTVVPSSGGDGEPDPDDMPGSGSGGVPSSNAGSTGAGATASMGGGGSTGGSAGSGSAGTAGSAGSPPIGAGDLIDGFEDEDLTLEQTGGRGGVWYLFDDATVGTAGPTPLVCSPLSGAPAELGGYAMHITATGFTGFGSGLGVDFRAGKKVYDASKFSGIRFWAKVGAGKNTRHRVQIADATTDKAGGKCNAAVDAPNGEKCDDHFGVNETFTSSWAQYVVKFDQLTQIGWGNPAAALDKAALYGLQVTAKPKLEVDLWLDQIEFF